MRRTASALLFLVAACSGSSHPGGASPSSSASSPGSVFASGSPCNALHAQINDQRIFTVGNARTWGPQPPGGSSRYAGYAASDRLAVCLENNGDAVGIFLKDGRQETLWQQSPTDHIILPI
ncbi:MAG: hypothetical protein ACJ735_17630 [Actinomycetes bacterium]